MEKYNQTIVTVFMKPLYNCLNILQLCHSRLILLFYEYKDDLVSHFLVH